MGLFPQFLAMKGIQIIPYQRLERWQSDLNYKSAILDNVAFKYVYRLPLKNNQKNVSSVATIFPRSPALSTSKNVY